MADKIFTGENTMKCKNCGNELNGDEIFCLECGDFVEPDILEEQKKKPRCKNCNEILDEKAIFCPGCGVKVTGNVSGKNEKVVRCCPECGFLVGNVNFCRNC